MEGGVRQMCIFLNRADIRERRPTTLTTHWTSGYTGEGEFNKCYNIIFIKGYVEIMCSYDNISTATVHVQVDGAPVHVQVDGAPVHVQVDGAPVWHSVSRRGAGCCL